MPFKDLSQIEVLVFTVYLKIKKVRKEAEDKAKERELRKAQLTLLPGGKK